MLGSTILSAALGLVFIYSVFSMVCSKVNEFLAARLRWRSQELEAWLRGALDPDDKSEESDVSAAKFIDTGLIKAILPDSAAKPAKKARKKKAEGESPSKKISLPSYIAPNTFSLAILDLLLPENEKNPTFEQVNNAIERLPKSIPARAALLRIAGDSQENMAKFRTGVETWFDDSMARVAGWYKKKIKLWLLGIAFVVSVAFNVDTITIARILWSQEGIRDAVVASASADADATPQEIADEVKGLQALDLPVGWVTGPKGDPRTIPATFYPGWILKFLGILMTVGAISLGAPFWFDLLNKVTKLRASGDKPASTSPSVEPSSPQVIRVEVDNRGAPAELPPDSTEEKAPAPG